MSVTCIIQTVSRSCAPFSVNVDILFTLLLKGKLNTLSDAAGCESFEATDSQRRERIIAGLAADWRSFQ